MNKLRKAKMLIVGLLGLLLITNSCNKEEKIASIKDNLSRQWQLTSLEKNGNKLQLKDFQKAAIWEFKENGSFIYTYDSLAIDGQDTSFVEGENTFIWKLSDDRDWILMTNGKVKTITTINGESVSTVQNLGVNGDYNMEILKLTNEVFNARVEMKDSEDKYTYDFTPR